MPFPNKSSYPKILSKVVAHWKEAESTSPRHAPFVLRSESLGKFSLQDLVELVLTLRSQLSMVQQSVEGATEARLIVNTAKRAILFRAQAIARNLHWKGDSGSAHITYPKITGHDDTFVNTLREMEAAWRKLNATTATPMILAGRYQLEDFINELDNLVDSLSLTHRTSALEQRAREKYDDLFEPISDILSQYRAHLTSILPAHSPLLSSFPAVSIPDDSVPPPTECSGTWLASENSALITWTGSTETRPHHHEIRYSPGDHYDPDVESTLAVIPFGHPNSWKGSGPPNPGSFVSLFRVYAVLKSGAESHGETISIIRMNIDD